MTDHVPPAPTPPATLDEAVALAPVRELEDILVHLPTSPGVYIMKDRFDKIIYIGKAGNLRNRVRQYFQPNTGDVRDFVPLLAHIVGDIETVVTSNEKEALLLENTLIKKHKPRFNVNLKDDKNYLVLRLDPTAAWPRLEVVRQLRDDGAFYFGPFHSASSCREALRVVNRHFQLRTCTDHVLTTRKRPCLQYQINRCPGPCVLPVVRDEYAEQVRDVRLFLDGKNDELMERLKGRMKQAAQALSFEMAATVRDQIRALESTLQQQHMVSGDFADQDVFGFYREGLALEIAVLSIRNGQMLGARNFSFGGQEFPDAELLSTFLGLYYDSNPAPPNEVLLPFAIDDNDVKAEWLSELRTKGGPLRRVAILTPQRGAKASLIDLAYKNAAATFSSRRNAQKDAEETLALLQRRLKLPQLPRVIECYDISHVQGTDTVASMVVFVDGRPEKSRYRTFKIKHVTGGGNDDFASMYEVLSRRFRRARESATENEVESGWQLPDLLVVDGGKGQLAMALAAARDVGIDTSAGVGLPIVGLAKGRSEEAAAGSGNTAPRARRGRASVSPESADDKQRPDRVFLPLAKDSIPIRPNSAEMFVLQQLRDESHRFAINFHRAQRRRRTLRSSLGDIPGIGPTRQRALLRHFGSLRKVREADEEAIGAVPGMSRASALAVVEHFARQPLPVEPPSDEEDATSEEAETALVEALGPDEGGEDDEIDETEATL
jgi:excinuclease ABC subunit C